MFSLSYGYLLVATIMTFSARSSHALTTLKSKVTELNPGLPIRRVLPQAKQRAVGSFVFLDHFGPTLSKMTVGPHPHIGLSTLTYLYQGSIVHRDSTGAHQIILPNQVNWMSSGRGVTHSERSEAGTMHGLQIWVALPKDQEDAEPSFHHASSVIPVSIDSDCAVQLVVGKFLGLRAT
jgi:redox-sensitive bicupin YhaK (pirin superfamily)